MITNLFPVAEYILRQDLPWPKDVLMQYHEEIGFYTTWPCNSFLYMLRCWDDGHWYRYHKDDGPGDGEVVTEEWACVSIRFFHATGDLWWKP